jgi:diguanylate cyclase (GGDEF)-like protein
MSEAQKILMIDDDHAFASMVATLVARFRRGQFVFEHVDDFAGGLRSLMSGQYDLCLLDCQLGNRSGLELLRAASALQCTTPVLFLTGLDTEETDQAAMEAGAMDFIAKGELTLAGLERAVCYALKLAGSLAALRELATHDELTGALNRREFENRLQAEWQRCRRFHRAFSLMMLDVDEFKGVNDTHGHPAGDEVLRHLIRVVTSQLRAVDSVGRYGGDEFAVLMVETDRNSALAAAARIHALLATTPCLVSNRSLSLYVRTSVGVAAWPEDAGSVEELMAAADAALYAAKRQGRNRVLAAG